MGVDRTLMIRRVLDRRLRTQLRLFMVIFTIMVVLVIYHLFRDHLNPLWAMIGFVPGLALGFILARTKILSWDASQHAVVGDIDLIGAIILVIYIVFIFFRSDLIGLEVRNADQVSVIGLAMTAGAMLGRVYFTMRGVGNILREAGLGMPGADLS